MSSIPYRPDIDGLRALAVLGVVVYHFFPEALPGGFIGVDVFFVISGFLITSIVLADLERGVFSLGTFWDRRIRRILPALLAVVLVTLAIGWALLFPPQFKLLCKQSLGALALHANHVALDLTQGYWGPAAETLPLLHTWSLAVEEQFYLLFPLLMPWLHRRLGLRGVLVALIALAAASFTACVLRTPVSPSATFYLLPTRAWEILAGAALAAHMARGTSINRPMVAAAALACLPIAMFLIPAGEGFPGWLAGIPVVISALLIRHGAASGPTTAILGSAPARYVGKISYSLYLWHWPMLVFARLIHPEASAAFLLLVLGATVLIAALSYHLVETPGRAMARPRVLLAAGLLPLCLVAAIAPAARGDVEVGDSLAAGWRGADFDAATDGRGLPKSKANGVVERSLPGVSDPQGGVARILEPGPGGRMALVIGDSHAMALGAAIESALADNACGAVFMTANGMKPGIGTSVLPCPAFGGRRLSDLQMEKAASRRFDLLLVVFRRDNLGPDKIREAAAFCRKLAEHGGIPRTVFVGQPPVLPFGDISAPEWVAWRKERDAAVMSPMPLSEETLAGAEQVLAAALAADPGAAVFPVRPHLVDESGRVRLAGADGLRYIDDDHLSEQGGALLRPHLSEAIRQALPPADQAGG